MDMNAPGYLAASHQIRAGLYDDETDRKKHVAYMIAIAQEHGKDMTEVAPRYEEILASLRGQARIHDYLNIFVAKKVLEQLKRVH